MVARWPHSTGHSLPGVMASPLRSLLLLATWALAMSSVLCARSGLQHRPPPKPAPTPVPTLNPKDRDVQRMLSFAMREYNMISNQEHLRRPLRLLSARKEVGDGTKYYLEVEMGKTICTKSQAKFYGWFRCPFDHNKETRRCRFMVHHKPKVKTTTLMDLNCHYPWTPNTTSRL
ncbi:cystatin-C-like [Sorex araneus]|uniref:cystatin-C-like n=1 Tax=Sorex araneus TaxID=42254 RepID=UPI002434083E|nr:cystatin-C-like [Sorex araneus]